MGRLGMEKETNRSIIDSGQEARAEILDYGGWPGAF
jgi:hypothetical protein